jgi:hypothetical protein
MGLSFLVLGTALLIGSVVGIPLGAWLGLAHFRGKRLVRTLVHTGMALPPVLVGLVLCCRIPSTPSVLLSRASYVIAPRWVRAGVGPGCGRYELTGCIVLARRGTEEAGVKTCARVVHQVATQRGSGSQEHCGHQAGYPRHDGR